MLHELESFFNNVDARRNAQAARPIDAVDLLTESDWLPFFADIDERLKQAELSRREIDKTQAAQFNVFRLIAPDENKLSDVLADLLNPDGTHGQGDAFLSLFCQKLGEAPADRSIIRATTHREAPTHGIHKFRRRIDILVHTHILLAIENKVDSMEQPDQVKDYLEHLQYYRRQHRIGGLLVYLTPNGRMPESLDPENLKLQLQSGNLFCWSYAHELRDWLQNCRDLCQAPRIRYYLSDFIDYIDTVLKRDASLDSGEVIQ